MASTIPEVIEDAEELFTELTDDLVIDLDFPDLDLNTDFPDIPTTGPGWETISSISVDDLTAGVVDGSGVFDKIMSSLNAHMGVQFEKGRITSGDYAKVYLGAVQSGISQGIQFLLSKDKAYYENLGAQAAYQIAQANRVRALADVELARAQIQIARYQTVKLKLDALTARNDFALSKMKLVTGYNEIQISEAQGKLLGEQYETARAQTKDTMSDGQPIGGLIAVEKDLKESQMLTAREELDTARSQTKDTLQDGSTVGGLVAIEKAFKEAQQVEMEKRGELVTEQVETARAQTRDTLSTGATIAGILGVQKLTMMAQRDLTVEQNDAARAQTKDTLANGQPIEGIAKHEKLLKQAQALLVREQYEAQRGQTRTTLSTGELVVGLIGAQTKLYEQQVVSYKRDAESKAMKLVMDSWIARKTIDEGVAVPANIDTPAINASMANYFNKLDLPLV